MNDKTDRSDPRTPPARKLRREATPAERRLWTQLRQLEINNVHFRRQAPIGPYFADFACHRTRLVVELDGEQHGFDAERLRDKERTRFLETSGYRVLRFWNHEVLGNLESVVDTICAALYQTGEPPTPNPSPPQAGGGE
jgi:very-short-patch-repair endonuclease